MQGVLLRVQRDLRLLVIIGAIAVVRWAARKEAPAGFQEREPARKETKISRSDPDSGYMVRDGKPKGFFYLDHRTVDGRCGIITKQVCDAGQRA